MVENLKNLTFGMLINRLVNCFNMNKIVALVFVCLLNAGLFAQGVDHQEIKRLNDLPEENIDLLIDRNIYVAGEHVHFNLYYHIEDEANEQLSNIVYIELFKPNGKKIESRKFRIRGMHASGSIAIPEETPSGNYIIRAYTQYMRNFSAASYANAYLFIINPEHSLKMVKQKKPKNMEVAIQGGGLISGVENEIALRLNQSFFNKVKAIKLKNNDNELVENCFYEPNELMLIRFTPCDSLRYFLRFDLKNKDSVIAALPENTQKQFQLLTSRKDAALMVNIVKPTDLPAPAEPFKIVIYNHSFLQKAVYRVAPEKNINTTEIPFEDLPEGAIYLALFNKRNTLLDLSAAYGKIDKPLNVNLLANQKEYLPRREVSIEIDPDFNEPASLLVAVVKKNLQIGSEKSLPDYAMDNPVFMQSYLLNQNNISDELVRQIDATMILYNQQINLQETEAKLREMKYKKLNWFPEIRDVSISGLVRNKQTKETVSGIPVYLSVLFNNPQIHINKTKEDGSFVFSLHNLNGLQDVFLYPLSYDDKEIEILINNDFSNKIPELNDFTQVFDSSDQQLLEEILVNHQINKLMSDFGNTNKVREKEHIIMFGNESHTIALKDYIKLDSTEEVFSEIIPYAKIRQKKNKYYCEVLDRRLAITYDNPLVLVDNVPLFNIKKLADIPPEKIESIGVLNETYIIGDNFIRGIVQVTTNTDDFAGMDFSGSSVFVEYQTIAKDHAHVDVTYSNPPQIDKRKPDFRNVLYWEPEFQYTGSPGQISFYTSDHCSEYDVIVRGFTADGRPCFGKTTIEVIR